MSFKLQCNHSEHFASLCKAFWAFPHPSGKLNLNKFWEELKGIAYFQMPNEFLKR